MLVDIEKKIKQIRELKDLSQEFVAGELGISTRAYSKIESGETQLSINRLNDISKILGVGPQEILGFDEKQIFNNCKQTGNIGINHIVSSDKLQEIYDEQIAHLKGEIAFLRAQIELYQK